MGSVYSVGGEARSRRGAVPEMPRDLPRIETEDGHRLGPQQSRLPRDPARRARRRARARRGSARDSAGRGAGLPPRPRPSISGEWPEARPNPRSAISNARSPSPREAASRSSNGNVFPISGSSISRRGTRRRAILSSIARSFPWNRSGASRVRTSFDRTILPAGDSSVRAHRFGHSDEVGPRAGREGGVQLHGALQGADSRLAPQGGDGSDRGEGERRLLDREREILSRLTFYQARLQDGTITPEERAGCLEKIEGLERRFMNLSISSSRGTRITSRCSIRRSSSPTSCSRRSPPTKRALSYFLGEKRSFVFCGARGISPSTSFPRRPTSSSGSIIS